MYSITIVFLCLVFLVVQQGINAISCYTCGIGTDGCGPSFSKTGMGVVLSTDSTLTYCVKGVYSTNNNAILRGIYSTAGTCSSASVTSLSTTYTQYCCSTDYCNEGSMRKASLMLALISAAIGVLLIK